MVELYRQYEFILKENEMLEKENSKIRLAINNYENKKNENNMVKTELEILEDSDIVYKLIGPILVKQEQNEAKIQVNQRLEMINKEINKLEKNLRDNNNKIEDNRKKLGEIQNQLVNLSKQLEQKKAQLEQQGK